MFVKIRLNVFGLIYVDLCLFVCFVIFNRICLFGFKACLFLFVCDDLFVCYDLFVLYDFFCLLLLACLLWLVCLV